MAKRKRGSIEERPADFGLGATLAHLKGDHSEHNSSKPADDAEGWTVVGAHKKRRKEHTREQGRDHKRRRSPRRYQLGSQRRSMSVDSASGSDDDARDERSKPATDGSNAFENPFALASGDSAVPMMPPSNPFSTHEKEADRAQESHTQDSSTESRNRAERRKERKLERHYPAIEHSPQARIQSPVRISDLQSLALYILTDSNAPQWVSVRSRMSIQQVVMLMVPGLDLGMFTGKVSVEAEQTAADMSKKEAKRNRIHIDPNDGYPAELKSERLPAPLKPLSELFPHVWPVKAHGDYRGNHQYHRLHSPIHTMLTSQIPKSREEKQLKKSGNHKGPVPQNSDHWEDSRTPVTEYVASIAEQQENEYVVHPAWFSSPEAKETAHQKRKATKQTSEDGWVDTKVDSLEAGQVPEREIESGSVTAGRRVLAVDCEMCKAENDESVLTRISVVDWDGNVVLDKLVKPDVTIKDYLTQWSGITQAMLQDVTTTLSDIQKELLGIITPHTVLVGHSLNSDLNAIKLTHPFLIDTGILYPHQRGPPYKQSLKWLAQKYLKKAVQKGANGHDSVEDARTALELVKQKCEKGAKWGTNETNAESIFKRLGRSIRPKSNSASRVGAVIDWGDPNRGHGAQAQVSIGCQSDSDVVQAIERAVSGQAQGKDGASEKVDFVWGRLRELELARGWWDDARTSEDVEAMRQAALKRLALAQGDEGLEVSGPALGDVVSKTVDHIVQIYDSLPRCTAFVVYSGTGDPRDVRRLLNMQQQYSREYQTKNWDSLSIKWTDSETQALSQACQRARNGVGFIVVK